jgi:hydroxyacylglutathione hydrolase
MKYGTYIKLLDILGRAKNLDIKTVYLENVNVFLLCKDNDCILIDTGVDGDGEIILDEINKLKLNLKYIIITHAHYDHAGGLGFVSENTEAKIICHSYEMPYLIKGESSILTPHGVSFEKLAKTMHLSSKNRDFFKPAKSEFIPIDKQTSLEDFGFSGYILPLPGHTPGSICIFTLDVCICGDTVFNVTDNHFPPIYNDKESLLKTFEKINNSGAKYIYPSHGKKFKVSELNYRVE